MNKVGLLLVVALLLGAAAAVWVFSRTRAASTPSPSAMQDPDYRGSASCRDCHEKFYQLWSSSFHGLAMQPYAAKLAGAQLGAQQDSHVFALPEDLQHRNVLVEIEGYGITRSRLYSSNSLRVQMSENYGQLKVVETETGKSLPKTYVKVYAEMKDGNVAFYKDGYTDLRGRFDYASLSTNQLDQVKRFSVLVIDQARGGLVREARIPKR